MTRLHHEARTVFLAAGIAALFALAGGLAAIELVVMAWRAVCAWRRNKERR